MTPTLLERCATLRPLAPAVLGVALWAQGPMRHELQPEPPPETEAVAAPGPAAAPAPPAAADAAAEPEVEPPAAIVRFVVDRATVQSGEWLEFQWETRNAAWVVLEPLGIRLMSTGLLIHRPPATATYWLSAVNDNGGQSWPLSIVVQPARGPFPVPAPVLPAPPVAMVPVPPAPAAPSPVMQVPAGTPEPAPRGFWIQFGALSSRAAAQTLLNQLGRALDEPISIEVAGPGAGEGRTFYRVHTGPYPTRAQALAKLREARRRIPARLAQPLIVEGSPPVPDRAAEPGKGKPGKARPGRVRHGHRRTRRS